MRLGIEVPRRYAPPMATDQELMKIHNAAIYLLKNVGIGGVTPKLQKTYKDLGCIVDEKKKIVKIPEAVAMEAINAIPSSCILPGRTPNNDIVLEAGSNRLHPGAFGIMSLYAKFVPETRQYEFRDGVDADNWNEQKVVEYFDDFDMSSPIYLPMDLAEAGLPVDTHDLNSTIQCTTKHIWHIDAIDHVDCYTDLAAEVLGGYEELAKRPFITNHGDTPGLVYGQKTCDRMSGTLDGWKRQRPLLIDHTDVCIPGFNGPMNLMGGYATTVAASISMAVGLALGEAGIAKGYIPDMTYDLVMTMEAYTQQLGCMEQMSKALAVHVNFWHRNYQTPKATMWPGGNVGGNSGAADTSGGQLIYHIFSGFQNGTDQMGFWPATVGPNGIRMACHTINAEFIRLFKHWAHDLDFSPGEWKYEEWLKKGPRGDFMKDKYTLANMAELGYNTERHGYGLYETRPWLRWIEDRLNLDDRAEILTAKIIKDFPAPLPPKDVADRMNAIVTKYDKMLQIGGYGVDVKGSGARF